MVRNEVPVFAINIFRTESRYAVGLLNEVRQEFFNSMPDDIKSKVVEESVVLDQTVKEGEHSKMLTKDLKRIRENGERGWYIRIKYS